MSTSTLEYALAEASQWLHRLKVLHGIDLTAQAHRKTVHEAVELADDPSLEEWADVAICLMGVALAQGWHFGELADAIHAKVAINAAREWHKQHDGTYQHAVIGGSAPESVSATDGNAPYRAAEDA